MRTANSTGRLGVGGQTPPHGSTLCPIECWDTYPPTHYMLGYNPLAHCMLIYTSPYPLHAGTPPPVDLSTTVVWGGKYDLFLRDLRL